MIDHTLGAPKSSTAHARSFSRRRVLAAGATVALAAVFATPAFGVQQRVMHLFRGADGPPATAIDASKAVRLLGVTDANGTAIELWRAPNQSGGQCIYVHRAEPTAVPGPLGSGGGVCSVGAAVPQTVPIRTFVSWRAEAGGASVLVGGHLAADSGISRVDLQSHGVATRLPLNDGYFLTGLPNASDVGALPDGGPYQVVGYDSSGGEVASVDLAQQVSRSEP